MKGIKATMTFSRLFLPDGQELKHDAIEIAVAVVVVVVVEEEVVVVVVVAVVVVVVVVASSSTQNHESVRSLNPKHPLHARLFANVCECLSALHMPY